MSLGSLGLVAGGQNATRRYVYLDMGSNWGNTLRFYRDLGAVAPSLLRVPAAEWLHKPWEIYAFEASPLIQPYLERFSGFLNGNAPRPQLPVPPAGSSMHLALYAGMYDCTRPAGDTEEREEKCVTSLIASLAIRPERARARCRNKERHKCAPFWRNCLSERFEAGLRTLKPEPALLVSGLAQERLLEAQFPNRGTRPRFTFVPAAAHGEDGHINLDDVRPEQMIRGGAHPGAEASRKVRHRMRVPAVDVASWIGANFRPTDIVIAKMDIEGSEYNVLEKLVAQGTLDRVDLLQLECHIHPNPPTGGGVRNCAQLIQKVKRWCADNHHQLAVLLENQATKGYDSLSTPADYFPFGDFVPTMTAVAERPVLTRYTCPTAESGKTQNIITRRQ